MKIALLFFLMVFMASAHAQDFMGFDISDITNPIIDGLTSFGFLPDLSAGFGAPTTKAFFVILAMLWLVFSVAAELDDLPSIILAFFITSWSFNNIPSFFSLDSAQGLFKYMFSALFVFIFIDYVLRYMWGLSRATKWLLNASITMMAVLFLQFTNIFEVIQNWIAVMVSGVGLIMFFAFMIGMRIFNVYFSMMNLRSAKATRRAGRELADDAARSAQRKVDSLRK